MSKNNENKLIPKLRFSEFENDGEWKEGQLIDICEINPKVSRLPDEFVYIDLESVDKGKLLQKKIINLEDAPSRAQRLLSDKDVIYQTVRPYQRNNYHFNKNDSFDYVASTGYAQLRAYKSSSFLYQLLHTDHFVSKVIKKCSGSNYPAINSTDLSQIQIEFPDNPTEQQKIAACLSSLDEVITAESQKLELLKDHKKALLQNLLPQVGETVPKFRFKEFEDSGEWVEKKLGEVADFINGRAYKQQELLSEGRYRVLRVGNFFTNNEWYYSDLELDEDKYCDNGDLLYAWSASFGPRIWIGEKVIYHYHIWKVKNKTGVNKKFLFNLLDFETERMKSQMANGFALLHITKGTIENWKSHIPVSEIEQAKIADTLSSVDDLINAQIEKVEALQLYKKGLLQGLFPNVNEVTV